MAARHSRADPEGGRQQGGAGAGSEDQDYPDNGVEVLVGHAVPFSGADPAHSSSGFVP